MFNFKLVLLLGICICSSAFAVFGQQGWKGKPSGAKGDLVAIYFTSSSKGFIAGDGGHLSVTNDGGKTWGETKIATTEDINEIYFRNADNGYLVAGRQLFITADGGNTWRETKIYRTGDFRSGYPELLSIRFADKKRGLAIGSILNKGGDVVLESLVMRTEDGGETWQRVTVPTKVELFHLDYNGSSRAWIVGDKGVILATTDSGKTWRQQRSGTDRALFNVDFRDDSEGYAVGGRGTILRTENGGDTWIKVDTNFPETFKRVDFADDKNGWIVGFNGSILRSSDKGKTWVRQSSGTKANLYGLFMTKRYGWAVGEKGLLLEYIK